MALPFTCGLGRGWTSTFLAILWQLPSFGTSWWSQESLVSTWPPPGSHSLNMFERWTEFVCRNEFSFTLKLVVVVKGDSLIWIMRKMNLRKVSWTTFFNVHFAVCIEHVSVLSSTAVSISPVLPLPRGRNGVIIRRFVAEFHTVSSLGTSRTENQSGRVPHLNGELWQQKSS